VASVNAIASNESHLFLFPHFRAKDLTTGDRKSGEYGRKALEEEGMVRGLFSPLILKRNVDIQITFILTNQ